MKMFWQDKYYNIKWGFWAIRKYLPIVWKMRDWDYQYNLEMMKFQTELLLKRIEGGMEVDRDRTPKEDDMKRVIELIDNKIKDNYAERCGYDYSYGFDFEDTEDGNSLLVSKETPMQEESNTIALHESHRLEENEWYELWDIMKKGKNSNVGAQGWWD